MGIGKVRGAEVGVIFNRKTGEVLSGLKIVDTRPRFAKNPFEGPFVKVSAAALGEVGRNGGLSGSDLKVLLLVCSWAVDGEVVLKQSLVAKELAIGVSAASRALRGLLAANLVRKCRGGYVLNPHVAFRGIAEKHAAAIKAWDWKYADGAGNGKTTHWDESRQ